MMRLLFSIVLMLISTMGWSQSWSIGGAAIYGDDIERAGVHLRGYYNFKGDRVCLGPEYSHFFKRTETHGGEEVSIQLNEFNFNMHYVFELNEHWGFYPLTGVNFSTEREEFEIGSNSEEHIVREFGANLGVGMHRFLGNWMLFVEYDHLFSELSQNSFLIGTFFTFGKKSENNEHNE